MAKQGDVLWTHLRRALTADPARFAGDHTMHHPYQPTDHTIVTPLPIRDD
jgi:hypothetical protein